MFMQPDNTVKYTEIKIFNLDNGKEYLVTSGLNSGDKIVNRRSTKPERMARRFNLSHQRRKKQTINNI
mgnify:CR=1 FL=1